ncbi:MAG: peptidyl-prolyl cis-trans isomerase [Phycisphaerales bacterium]|nr:peptidyl-prolyl cis-trans isomerase [Phycisphaerales bacterium]
MSISTLVTRRRSLLATAGILGMVSVAMAASALAQEAPKKTVPRATTPVFVAMTTSKGTIYLELNSEKAPMTVANFTKYAKDGFYDGTIFHRVMKTFMIQGGGFTADLTQKPNSPAIKNEWQNGLSNTKGTIAMARLGNRADSATSQFFINTADNLMLDEPRDGAGYAVFGRVISGMNVVEAIAAAPVGQSKGMGNVPKEVITITKVEILAGPPPANAPTLLAPPPVAPAKVDPATAPPAKP